MGKYDLKIKRLDTGKVYEYPTMLITSPSEQNQVNNVYYLTGNILLGTMKQLSEAVPLFSFLEFSRIVGTEIPIEINGHALNGRIQRNNIDASYVYWTVIYQGISINIYEPMDLVGSSIWDTNFKSVWGTALVYNYTDSMYYLVSGGTNFEPSSDRNNFVGAKIYYNGDFHKGGQYVLNKQDLQTGGYYQSPISPMDTANLANYYFAQFEGNQTGLAKFLNNMSDKPKPPVYPDPNPDDPDPQPPSPDPPIPGDGDTESDPVPDPPPLPTWDVTNTGFVVIYNPTVQEIRDLAYFMWSGEFVDLIKKMFGSPFEALISLKMLFSPVVTGAKQTVWLGNVETTVSMSKVTQQFVDIDMGTIDITEFFGSFADYAPYTKIHIFLPFIGYKDLNVDEVMNAQIHLRYRIDVYSGACIAFITVTKAIKSTQLNSILYQFDGNCAMEIPFTSNDNSRYVSAILNAAASSALSLANTSSFSPPQVASGFQKGEKASLELGSLAPVANGMLDVLSVKPNVQRAGSLAGAVAAMGIKTPYIIIHRPIAQIPTDYQHYYGIPLNLSMQFSKLSGFTVVSQVFFQSQIATEREIEMITELLRNGVIF